MRHGMSEKKNDAHNLSNFKHIWNGKCLERVGKTDIGGRNEANRRL